MKLIYSIYKEYKVLTRDRAGLAITFIMPTVLILIMTLIQDSTFKSVNESSVPLLFVDRDHDSLSETLKKYIDRSKFFVITEKQLSNEEAKKEIAQGHFFIGIIVPENTSKKLRERSTARVTKLLDSFSGDSAIVENNKDTSKIELNLFLFGFCFQRQNNQTLNKIAENILSGVMRELVCLFYNIYII